MWQIWIDTGGTFTDCLGVDPDGNEYRAKVLSNSSIRGVAIQGKVASRSMKISEILDLPENFFDGIEIHFLKSGFKTKILNFNKTSSLMVLESFLKEDFEEQTAFEIIFPFEPPILGAKILTNTLPNQSLPPLKMRLATTRGTNALLERGGSKVGLLVTKGFADILKIGTQQRPDLFSLDIKKPKMLYESVFEVDERISSCGEVLNELGESDVNEIIENLKNENIETIAISLMNGFVNSDHELAIKKLIISAGFKFISVSSELSEQINYFQRTSTTVIDAYLSKIMETYLDNVEKELSSGQLEIMTSAGGLIQRDAYHAKDSLLSGPAGGLVGAAGIGHQSGYSKIIPFDMGGTSTDVSRYNERFEYVRSHVVGDAKLLSNALKIETVAAGGGSVCSFNDDALSVGPESARAFPGPACYGAGGPLTITDVNLLLGRLDPNDFNIPVFPEESSIRLYEILERVNVVYDNKMSREQLLTGFLKIANEIMANAITKISVSEGYDSQEYVMVAFGGAGGQSACHVAEKLSIRKILCPYHSGILSAFGLKQAVREVVLSKRLIVGAEEKEKIKKELELLSEKCLQKMGAQVTKTEVRSKTVYLRLVGQESTLPVLWDDEKSLIEQFEIEFKTIFGYIPQNIQVEVETIQVIVAEIQKAPLEEKFHIKSDAIKSGSKVKSFVNDEWQQIPVYKRKDLKPHEQIKGPAILQDHFSTTFIEDEWVGVCGSDRTLLLEQVSEKVEAPKESSYLIDLELYTNRFRSIVDEMGLMLERTSVSTNIRDRLDLSCALLDAEGNLIVNAPHVPVHLGAMSFCVKKVVQLFNLKSGDVILTNHPGFGGSHLPDVTVITPVFINENEVNNHLIGYVANRAHHAEIGGTRPGSMVANSTCLEEEGVIISPFLLYDGGKENYDKLKTILGSSKFPSRRVEDNLADIRAQVAANLKGEEALLGLCKKNHVDSVKMFMGEIMNNASRVMDRRLALLPSSNYHFKKIMDDGTLICVKIHVDKKSIEFDFSGSSEQHKGNLNATPAIVRSAVIYFLRVFVNEELPLNDGLMKNVEIVLPTSFLNPDFKLEPEFCAAVTAGNVETSQAIVDCLIRSFDMAGSSQGTMNNFIFGNDRYSYYETIGGGAGATNKCNGADAVHTHMTNTAITDPEILEKNYPVILNEFSIRKNSGGEGRFKGGEGILRKFTFLDEMEVSLITQNRTKEVSGSHEGGKGKSGTQVLIKKNGKKIKLSYTESFSVSIGDQVIIETPGGGGYGKK